jgi:hypothetical protein
MIPMGRRRRKEEGGREGGSATVGSRRLTYANILRDLKHRSVLVEGVSETVHKVK